MAGIWRWKTAQFAERKWWQLYLKSKDIETYLQWKRVYWESLLTKVNHYVSISYEALILDAGCGPAGIFMAFPHHQVTAFDPLIDQYEHDLPHFKKARYTNVNFYQSDLENFQTEQRVDVVFCMNAINHVHDLQASFNQLHSFGKPDSVIVITIDAHTHTLFKKLFRLLPGDILHPHQHDLNEYQQMLLKRGYDLLGTELLKHTFLFDHYMLIAKKVST